MSVDLRLKRFYFPGMSTVAEIREAIEKLSLEERVELMIELAGGPGEDDDWDQQMKADAKEGKFDEMNRRIDAEYAAGLCRPIEDLCE